MPHPVILSAVKQSQKPALSEVEGDLLLGLGRKGWETTKPKFTTQREASIATLGASSLPFERIKSATVFHTPITRRPSFPPAPVAGLLDHPNGLPFKRLKINMFHGSAPGCLSCLSR